MFAVAFSLGLALRVITMLGFPPAIWFGGDSASYVATALYHSPGTSRLSGYGLMLFLLSPFHSFAVVTVVQHLLGLAVAVMIYALLRRYGLPGWGATLATVPVLFDAFQIQLEHEILPTAPFGFLVMVAILLTLWWRGRGPVWATVAAGAALAVGATFWPVGLPMLIVFLAYLLLRRVGWRTLVATAVALVLVVSWVVVRSKLRWRAVHEVMVPFDREVRNLSYGAANLRLGRPILCQPPELSAGSRVALAHDLQALTTASAPSPPPTPRWVAPPASRPPRCGRSQMPVPWLCTPWSLLSLT